MNPVAIDSKQLIQEYFKALSGRPKTEEVVNRYVADPALKEHIRSAESAFPEYELVPNLMVTEGDLVAAQCTFRGVHKGEFAGIEPTNKSVAMDLMIFYRIQDARITKHWIQMDTRGLIEQLTQ
jgi:predicted ester cyclase